jgi:type IV pilus assembly protein PilF
MKNVFKLALIAQLIISGCGSTSKKKEADNRRAGLHYAHGTEALVNKEYTTALDHLIKANKLRPNQSNVLNNLGMAFYFKKEQPRALKNLLLSLKADPKNSDARTNLASLYLEMNKLNKAEEHYRVVLLDLVYKHQYRVHYNLALVEKKRGSYDKSIVQLKKAIEIKEDYCPANFKMGNLAYRRYDYQTALKFYKDATKGSCYNLAEPHLKQAEAMIQLKKYTEARLKLTDVKNQFKGTRYDTLAKVKLNDLDNLEKQEFYSNKNNNNFYNK